MEYKYFCQDILKIRKYPLQNFWEMFIDLWRAYLCFLKLFLVNMTRFCLMCITWIFRVFIQTASHVGEISITILVTYRLEKWNKKTSALRIKDEHYVETIYHLLKTMNAQLWIICLKYAILNTWLTIYLINSWLWVHLCQFDI